VASFKRASRKLSPFADIRGNPEIGVTDLAVQIIECLKNKSAKSYPSGTVLIVNCVANGLILGSEWNEIVQRVTGADVHRRFREVFLLEMMMSHSATL
jgi:hypothetical protein